MTDGQINQFENLSDPGAERQPPAFEDGRGQSLVSRTTALRRITCFVILTLVCLPIHVLLRQLTARNRWLKFCRWYHKRTLWCFDVNLIEVGRPSSKSPTLFVTNHNSYLDIAALGACLEASFVAMDQVKVWPVFGLLSKLQDTLYIDRQVKSISGQQRQFTERFDQGHNLIMFPEGSSYSTTHTLPFRSSLLAVAKHKINGEPLLVQPASVTFAKLDGLPIHRNLRAFYGWYGDANLFSHMFSAAGLGKLSIQIEWHEPKTLSDFDGNRKALTAYCEKAVKRGMARARIA